jgi:hypothetical protein
MWLSKRKALQSAGYAEEGTLTINNAALRRQRPRCSPKRGVYAPYGYSFSAPVGESVLIINGSGGACCAGVRMAEKGLQQGEIEIESLGGAKIRLLNDGTISLNGLIISADGSILNAG